jgi:hypothetical protein
MAKKYSFAALGSKNCRVYRHRGNQANVEKDVLPQNPPKNRKLLTWLI